MKSIITHTHTSHFLVYTAQHQLPSPRKASFLGTDDGATLRDQHKDLEIELDMN